MNIVEIGKLIGEEIAKEPGICFYPGGFKPPHKGHFSAAQQLAKKPYITQVKVLIGHGKRGGITAEQSKAIWDIYLKAQPNPKIVTEIASTPSPIKDIYRWFADDLNREAYVAAAGKEADDLKYFEGLKNAYGDRVKEEIVDDQFVDSDGERVSGTDFRATIAELKSRYLQVKNNPGDKRALNDYNTTYLYFKSLFPEAVIQKGYLDDIQKVLGINFPEPTSLQESQPNPKKQPQWVWLEYKNQNKLNPIIFGDDDKVDPEVKDLLLKIATYFWEELEIPQPFDDVILTGSSVNYNYTPTSDIDLHIVIDFNKFDDPELVKKFFDNVKVNWNKVHDLKLGTHNIEVYIQDTNDHPEYRAEYSLMKDEWLNQPSYNEINIPDKEIEKKAKIFKQQINKLIKTGKDNPEKSIELINKIKERLKNFRQTGLDKNGEYSLENLAFKNLRNTGYLEKLSDLKNTLVDKTLSLTESVDKNSLFEKFMSYACQELQIHQPPTLEIKYEFGEDQPSFGAYVPSNHHIFINPSNRNVVDVLRTLAHELVHAKQNELGILQPDSGETGSDHENDANSIAGILMRDYGKQNPNIYNIGILNETRQGIFNWLKKKLPNTPEYVIRDWIYKMITQSDDVNTREGIIEWIDEWVKDLKWETKTNFPITMDIFSDKTQKELKSRIGGEIRQDVDKDIERHKTQQNLLKSQGVSKEPIILFKTKDGKYELGEGWHRTTQTFKIYPEGFIQPNVYIGLNAKWLNESIPQPGISSGKASDFDPKTQSKRIKKLTLDQILHQVKNIPYYKEVLDDINKGDESWEVTKKVKEYAEYMKKNPSSISNMPPIIVINDKINDGAHRISALYLLSNKLDPKGNWNKKPITVEFRNNLNEEKKTNPPIIRIYLDMDGVIAGFDNQFKKYNKEGLDFKEYIGKYGSNKAWDIINKGKTKFWSGMDWNPGGQQLYNKVIELADKKGFEVWILSSPGLDPNGDATKGKNEWLDKHTNIPQKQRVFKQAKDKHTEAKPGYMLIDDMGKNVSEFINAGGTGIKNNPNDSTESIKKLYKFKYE